MPETEPNMGEIVRRLDQIVVQLSEMTREIKEDRKEAALTYVHQNVYLAQRQADAAVVADLHGDIQTVKTELGRDIKGIQDDRKTDLGWRRQMWLAIGVLAVTSLIGVAGLVINFTSR